MQQMMEDAPPEMQRMMERPAPDMERMMQAPIMRKMMEEPPTGTKDDADSAAHRR